MCSVILQQLRDTLVYELVDKNTVEEDINKNIGTKIHKFKEIGCFCLLK